MLFIVYTKMPQQKTAGSPNRREPAAKSRDAFYSAATIFASGAFFRTEAMPFMQLFFDL